MLRLRRARHAAPDAAVPVPVPHAEELDLVGYIDEIGVGSILGWAASRSAPSRRVRVRLYLDDKLSAEGIADDSRHDVRDAGYGDGLHGFQLTVPKAALFCAEMLNLAVLGEDGAETLILRHRLRHPLADGAPSLYLDASDFIEFLTHHREFSGIQRVQAGYLLGLGNALIAGTPCRICTRFKTSGFYFDIPYEAFTALLREAGDLSAVPKTAWAHHIRRFKANRTTRTELKRGDTIFTMGAPWALDDHNETIRCAKFFYGVHYLQIFYDLIPISMPEVVAAPLIPHFARAMAAMSIYADHIYAISRYSRDDLADTLRRLKRFVPSIDIVSMGGSITDAEGQPPAAPAEVLSTLGIAGPFVLCVGTIEPRKNHALLFQVWRRLVAEHGADNVPKLVLVGRFGWYMEDFMRQLKVTGFVERTVVHLEGIGNAELATLYDACLFTAFPSFSEGWGLPITESLARGKICVCSNVTSMPEAGGDHALYIDPHDTTAAFRLCERLMFDGAFRAEQEARARGFVAPTWAEASETLRGQIADLLPRLAVLPKGPPSKPIELGRTYDFSRSRAAASDLTATEVFRDFLDREDALDLLVGWNWFDDPEGAFACGPHAELSLILPEGNANLLVYLDLVIPPCCENKANEIRIDGVFKGRRTAPGAWSIRFALPEGKLRRVIIALWSESTGSGSAIMPSRSRGMGIGSLIVFAEDNYRGRLKHFEDRAVEVLA